MFSHKIWWQKWTVEQTANRFDRINGHFFFLVGFGKIAALDLLRNSTWSCRVNLIGLSVLLECNKGNWIFSFEPLTKCYYSSFLFIYSASGQRCALHFELNGIVADGRTITLASTRRLSTLMAMPSVGDDTPNQPTNLYTEFMFFFSSSLHTSFAKHFVYVLGMSD